MGFRELKNALDQNIDGIKYFKWSEALWLPSWGIYAVPNDQIAKNIVEVAKKMDLIREYFDSPVICTSWYRPEAYNEAIGGAKASAHLDAKAVDFIVSGIPSYRVREALKGELECLDIRMEDKDTPHVHIDINPVGNKRYFIP
jgi:hypothetical protein